MIKPSKRGNVTIYGMCTHTSNAHVKCDLSRTYLLKLIDNSSSLDKGNRDCQIVDPNLNLTSINVCDFVSP